MGIGKKPGKGDRSSGDATKIQKLASNNRKLTREIARLRKMIGRIESGSCPSCVAFYEDPSHAEDLPSPPKTPTGPDRLCHKCQQGQLVIVKYYKLGEEYYFRKCPCGHRTRGKKYTPEVQD